MTPGQPLPSLVILPVRADEMRAEIAVRMSDSGRVPRDPAVIVGSITGPRRGRDTTLPTVVPLSNRVAAAPAEARAIFTEPAYWTPESPNLYRLEARLACEGRSQIAVDRWIGLRRLGVRGRSFWLDGRRWVPRGVSLRATDFEPPAFRELLAAAEIGSPSDSLLTTADATGVAVIARLQQASGEPLDRSESLGLIAAWTLHPAVMIAVVPQTTPVGDAAAIVAAARAIKGTMLIALEVDGTRPPESIAAPAAAAADCLIVDLPRDRLPHDAWRRCPVDKPLVCRRPPSDPVESPPPDTTRLAGPRRACDRLQAALAAWGMADGDAPADWAGYLSVAW